MIRNNAPGELHATQPYTNCYSGHGALNDLEDPACCVGVLPAGAGQPGRQRCAVRCKFLTMECPCSASTVCARMLVIAMRTSNTMNILAMHPLRAVFLR